MTESSLPFHGLLVREERAGRARLIRTAGYVHSLPCPSTGRALRVAAVDSGAEAMCPSCGAVACGAFVSFVSDLRMAYACPACQQFVWLASV